MGGRKQHFAHSITIMCLLIECAIIDNVIFFVLDNRLRILHARRSGSSKALHTRDLGSVVEALPMRGGRISQRGTYDCEFLKMLFRSVMCGNVIIENILLMYA